MKGKLAFLFTGLLLGWITVPMLQAQNITDNTYKGLIHHIIVMLSQIDTTLNQIEITSAETAVNTQALRQRLGAK